MRFYIVEVGDDLEDEKAEGPFPSMASALRNMDEGRVSFYVLHHSPGMDWLGPYVRGWHGTISSIYIFGVEDGAPIPTYEKDILPLLHKQQRGEIKLLYDEE